MFSFRLSLLAVFFCSALLLGSPSSLHAQPDDVVERAQLLLMEGQPEKAQRLLAAADSLSPAGSFWLGRAHQSLFQHAAAVTAFARSDTTQTRVLAAWGRSLHQLGRTGEALIRYRQAHQQDSTSRAIRLALADLHADAHQWPASQSYLKSLLQSDPENAVLHAQLARAYQATDSTALAIQHYTEAIALNPSGRTAPLRLSRLYQRADSVEAAQRVLQQALHHHPRNPRVWRQRGQVAFQANRPDSAIVAFRTAINLGDSSTTNVRSLGKGYYLTGQYQTALPLLHRAFQADTSHAATALFLGIIHKNQGRPDSSLYYLDRAASLFGRSTLAGVYEQMADAHKQRAAYSQAIEDDRTALALAPDKVAVIFHLATLYDTYYADPGPARQHYRLFLRRTGPEDFTKMRAFAEYRLKHLDEREFFQRAPTTPVSDSAR